MATRKLESHLRTGMCWRVECSRYLSQQADSIRVRPRRQPDTDPSTYALRECGWHM